MRSHILAFDLGGGGLKACLMGDECEPIGQPLQLCACPEDHRDSLRPWFAKQLDALRASAGLGEDDGRRMAFALASPNKFFVSRQWNGLQGLALTPDTIRSLLDIEPSISVSVLSDGAAHALASKHLTAPAISGVINIAVGTGLGIGGCRPDGTVITDDEIHSLFGHPPWTLQVRGGQGLANFAASKLGARGYAGLLAAHGSDTPRIYQLMWLRFLEEHIVPKLYGPLTGYVTFFTGGMVEADCVQPECLSEGFPTGLGPCRGPRDAGLRGAAWHFRQLATDQPTS